MSNANYNNDSDDDDEDFHDYDDWYKYDGPNFEPDYMFYNQLNWL
jgi:hypothetical protein